MFGFDYLFNLYKVYICSIPHPHFNLCCCQSLPRGQWIGNSGGSLKLSITKVVVTASKFLLGFVMSQL